MNDTANRTNSSIPTGAPHYMSTDTTAVPTTTPQVAVNDIGTEEDFLAAIDQTIKYFNDGDIVEGTIVKVDRDEVLLDIGYKTEGVIPSRELSIKHDVDPADVVEVGEFVEALVLQHHMRVRRGERCSEPVVAHVCGCGERSLHQRFGRRALSSEHFDLRASLQRGRGVDACAEFFERCEGTDWSGWSATSP